MLVAFHKFKKLRKTFHLIETQNGLITFYITNFTFMQGATLVYGVLLAMVNSDSVNSCKKDMVIGLMNLLWNLPALSTCILMAVTISRLSKPTFIQKAVDVRVRWAQDFNLVNFLIHSNRKHRSDREERVRAIGAYDQLAEVRFTTYVNNQD